MEGVLGRPRDYDIAAPATPQVAPNWWQRPLHGPRIESIVPFLEGAHPWASARSAVMGRGGCRAGFDAAPHARKIPSPS